MGDFPKTPVGLWGEKAVPWAVEATASGQLCTRLLASAVSFSGYSTTYSVTCEKWATVNPTEGFLYVNAINT